ncbi:hypothetical protein niasHT_032774 [Heterodera trifolii]|uniref:Seipin n=2 Tax=Heterodera trifolii TaxID=157864 RepID=A0ABD2IGK2_9BILA
MVYHQKRVFRNTKKGKSKFNDRKKHCTISTDKTCRCSSVCQMLFSFCFRFLSGTVLHFWHSMRKHISLAALLTLCLRLISLFMLSLITPVVIRRLFASNFVELQQPLEFIFKTCSDELAGVCSFPEAQFSLAEEDIHLQPGYYYSFVLDVILFDTPQNRQLSIVLASVMLKDERMKLLFQFHKTVPIFNAFSARSVLSRLYTLTRNIVFWPLYLVGFFSTAGHELSELFSIHFPNYYLEREGRPTRFIVVQLQNKFIQLSSATLRVRTHLNIVSAFVSEYPVLSYALMFCACFALFFSAFFLFHCVQFVRRWSVSADPFSLDLGPSQMDGIGMGGGANNNNNAVDDFDDDADLLDYDDADGDGGVQQIGY